MLPASHSCTDSPHTAHSTITGHAPAILAAPLPIAIEPACDKLFQDISEGDVIAATALLSNHRIHLGTLHAAAEHSLPMHALTSSHIPIVEALLHAGAAVNQPPNDGMTALILATHHAHTSPCTRCSPD